MRRLEALTYLLFPVTRLRRTPWLSSWKQREAKALRVNGRAVYLFFAIGHLAHLLVDRGLRLPSGQPWLYERLSIAAICLVAFALTFAQSLQGRWTQRAILVTVGLIVGLIHSHSSIWLSDVPHLRDIWSAGIPYIYGAVFAAIFALALHINLVATNAYIVLYLLVEWPQFAAAGYSGARLWSIWLVAIACVSIVRARMASEVGAFVAEQEKLEAEKKLLQKEIEQRQVEEANRLLEARVASRTSQLRESNEKLEEALAQQRELDKLKTQFFDNVSHELRTPLTIILLSLESLLQRDSGTIPPAAREHLQAMDRSATRLIRLINNLLDLAKLEAGKKRLQYQPVEMATFLKSMIVPFNVVARERKIQLAVEGEAATPIHVDAEMMDVVFQNLVSNALKFTSKGSVIVRVSETAQDVQIEVVDTGLGMAAADLAVIFDRFSQADSSGLRRFGGTGIGLALVKETVELHGGSIEVTSEQNVGSTFRVKLPKGEAHIREDLRERRLADFPVRRDRRTTNVDPVSSLRPFSPQGTPPPAVENGPESGGESGRANKILVIEDDAEIRRYVVQILREEFTVSEAVNGEDGLRKARSERPDLVVCDVMMPVMSGLQMAAAVRDDPELMDLPIIMLTSRGEVESRLTGLSTGANDYMSKPFSPRELLARVDTQLRIREAAARVAQNERLSALGLLSSGFAHEVRNPLNGLLNALDPLRDLLRHQPDKEAAAACLSIISSCGERVRQLAESLLSFARSDDREAFIDVPAGIEATLNVLGWKTPKGVTIVRHFNCTEKLRGNPGTLNMLWLNLIDNALHAVGEEGTLTLATERVKDEMVVSIHDTGVGIPKEVQERIFEPFFSTRTAGTGTGLGLALSRRIVLRHGGRIELSSEVGKGSEFRVRFPLLDRPGPLPFFG